MSFPAVKRSVRNLLRNRLYSALNLSGLAIGMAAAMLIALWVQNELRFDGFHRRAAHLFRIKTDLQVSPEETWHWGSTPLKINELCAQTPGIVSSARIWVGEGFKVVLGRGADLFEEEKFGYVAPGWFETFDYEFAEGSADGFGDRPTDLILTENLARKIFPGHPALGQVLRMDSTDFVVHAVLRDPRPESSFRQNLLLPLEAHLRAGNNRRNDEDWSNFNYNTFLELRPGTSPEAVGKQLTTLLQAAKRDSGVVLHLGALTDLHFDQSIEDDVFEKGSRRSVAAFGLIGLLILGMAAVNYVSLTTARAQTRAREAGIRKMVGAGRGQLFGQFLGESVLLTGMAGGLALGLVHLSLPWFSQVAEREFSLPLGSPLPWVLALGTLAATVLLAGVYPAVLMAGFQPMQVLRGASPGVSGGAKNGAAGGVFRQSLVVAQFAVSVSLLICTVVIGRQRAFIAGKEMGYEREQIFTFQIGWNMVRQMTAEQCESAMLALEQRIRQSAAVAGVSRANESPVQIRGSHSGSVKFDGLPEEMKPTVSKITVDEHFAQLFGLQMVEGRWFGPGNAADAENVVLNETAARKLGLPQPWLGQRFGINGMNGRVIGLVRDFHFLPLREAITPLVMMTSGGHRGHFFIKTQPGASTGALAAAETEWKKRFPERPFRCTFLEEDFDKMYRSEARAGLLFNVFSGIAIFIACLGLFGLATFTAAQRTKEIGVRKVLGATVAGITGLLARDFLKLVVLSLVIAAPMAWWLMQNWLSDFAYRIDLQWWMFAGAGATALLLAGLTVGFQSVRAALQNPVKSLRSE